METRLGTGRIEGVEVRDVAARGAHGDAWATRLERTAHHLLKLRQRAGDLHLAPLMLRADAIRQSQDADSAVREFVDAALDARSLLEFRFWTAQARDGIAAMPPCQAQALYRHLTQVIAACFRIERRWTWRRVEEATEPEPAETQDDADQAQVRAELRNPDLVWLGPSDPIEYSAPSSSWLAVALGGGTGELAHLVQLGPSGKLRLIGRNDAGDAVLASSASSAGLVPGPAAWSRLSGEVVQLMASDSAAPLDTIRIQSFGQDPVDRTLTQGAHLLMTGQAATYVLRDHRLWVIGDSAEASRGNKSERWLIVVDLDRARVEATRRVVPSLSRTWLSTTAEGDVVLVAAMKRTPWFLATILRAQPEHGGRNIVPVGARVHAGRVIGAPRISGGALLVPVADNGRGHAGDKLNPSRMRVEAIAISDLEQGADGPCFSDP